MTGFLDILDRLIGFETTPDRSNAEMVDYIAAFCTDVGATCTRLPSSSQPGKTGLVARFGPQVQGGIVLSGHCDVVPVEGQKWTRAPFRMTREGDRLYGRGTTDMKGFLACMMAAGQTAAQGPLAKPLILVFSFDEEIGCVGIQEMAEALPPLLGAPRLCIVGEPTEMAVAIGHKGKVALRVVCTGQNGHSALAPEFVNALHLASDFMSEIRGLQDWFAQHGARDAGYDIPFSTFHIGTLTGGNALNIVPDRAEMQMEYRYLPADDEAAIRAKIATRAEAVATRYRDRFADAQIAVETSTAYPGLDINPSSDAAQFTRSLAQDAPFTKVAFGTEAGVFTRLGLPTLVCGPGSMSGQGHKPDEYLEMAQVENCQAMLGNAIERLR